MTWFPIVAAAGALVAGGLFGWWLSTLNGRCMSYREWHGKRLERRRERRMASGAFRKVRRDEYAKARQRGLTRTGAMLYAYAYSRPLGWPWRWVP
jgi:hypothetical protein